MKLSLSMWSMHRTTRENQGTVLDFLTFCQQEGIGQVELLDVFWKDKEAEIPAVLAFLKENGITLSSYAVGNDFVKGTPGERAEALRVVKDGIETADRLGTSVVRVFSGNMSDAYTFDSALEWIVSGLGEAAALAERAGITLCLENHGKMAGKGDQVLEILKRVGSPALKSTFDTGNFLLVDEKPLHALEVLLPYIGHVHIKDFAETPEGRYKALSGKTYEGVFAGEGDVRLDAIVSRLKEAGYNGAYVLEYEGTGDEAEGIRKSYENFNHLVQTKGD
ncbi:sugar phosphate isomerase/epimerase [Paenibacillus chitinolyticus]|uniref:sugar phosphate isomerase/epimerase family protein n=1 Tax=Paenibacillus chitinolyticus TaxID=79263 RepID=UPI002DB65E94|nr:sugar phosphate isomerase/epimerase family protein [Paenibacillus chitinolyticus]MEC0245500.1 sugar phosphate isomerase/epimerase [Paenibacillus chitinolyticus]